jgi:Zn-dependent protease with chaperone function
MLTGTYYDGRSAQGHAVTVTCSGELLFINGIGINRQEHIDAVSLSERLGQTQRQLQFTDGAACEVPDSELLNTWFASHQQHRRWNLLASLERNKFAIAASVTLIAAMVLVLTLWGIPSAAKKLAQTMPQVWVDQIASGAFDVLDQAFGDTSTLSLERQQQLREQFETLADAAQVKARFEFRRWEKLGPNAVALPDGVVVMTDALVQLATDDRELLAVIAHELGHQKERHMLQKLISNAGVAGLTFALLGDVSGMANVVVLAPTVLTSMSHSRALESDADNFGFALLQQNGIEPAWFASIIRKLGAARDFVEEQDEDDKDAEPKKPKSSDELDEQGDIAGWLNSHPATEERARAAESFGKE